MTAIEYGANLNRLLHSAGQHLMQLFPGLSICSLAEMQRREMRLPPKRYSWCAFVFTNRSMYEAVDQLSELYLNPDFSYQLKAYPCALTQEQKLDYHQLIGELIATLDKLDNQLAKATYYTATFDVWAVASDQTSFFNVIAWISEARNWLSDIRPVLISCLPQSPVIDQQADHAPPIVSVAVPALAPSDGKLAKVSRPSSAKEARYSRIRKYVDEFMSLEGKTISEAMQCAAYKEVVSLDTVERAMGLRK